jgi:moderate conductance mechanosensitive channel
MQHLLTAPLVLAQLFAQTDAEIQQVCSEHGLVCTAVYRATDWVTAAQLLGTVVPSVLRIALIVAAAYVLNRLMRRAVKRFMRKVAEDGIQRLGALRRGPLQDTAPVDISRAKMRTETIGAVVRSVGTAAIYTMAALAVLGEVGVNLGPLLAGAGIVGVAIGFGSQTLVRDFLSGIFMILEDQYGIGDIVDVGEASGVVEAVTLRTTKIRDVEGTVWWVPNGEVRRVGNKSQLWARSLIDVGVAYDTDLEQAFAVIKQVADSVWHDAEFGPMVIDEPEVWGVENFGPNEIVIRLVVKVEPAKQWILNRELRRRLKLAFDEVGIEIPFPQRTLWVRGRADGPAMGAGDGRPEQPTETA